MRQNAQNVSPMSNEGRNAYVVEHLTDALLELLTDKPLEDISISELCERAGVGRASFYRNFDSKEDILRSHTNRIFREWLDCYGDGGGRPLSANIQSLFEHFERHMDFYKLLNAQGMVYLIKDAMVDAYGPKQSQSALEAYARAYAVYAFYGWIEVWFQRGMQETAEEIAALFQGQGL